MLKVRQVNSASRFAFLRSRLGPPYAIIGEAVGKVAQRDFRSEFRGKSRQAVRAFPRALAATDADHNERIEGEAVAIISNVRFFVPSFVKRCTSPTSRRLISRFVRFAQIAVIPTNACEPRYGRSSPRAERPHLHDRHVAFAAG